MPDSSPPPEYQVVARRYRPQAFDDLIGQEHVARALSNAIATHRVGHAYLFTGARGVGKTSAARIFAKALNCVQGPTATPCNVCEICQGITAGDDVDVLEFDGASNRGIDEIRQLRQNAGVRPSRARLKIYIIDEVHMLTREAFNALLKTLEEPPEHVKFIFCTTDPNKLPITILSRCQRFDFSGIQTGSIAGRLAQIASSEGIQAEPAALEVLARRAAGSMRDGQSLLEQLLAFAPERITVADVHGMLGTAGDDRLERLVEHLSQRNAAGALAELETCLGRGVDVGLLIEQLFGYLRDCLAAAVGCPGEMFLYASPGGQDKIRELGRLFGVQTLLAVMQILDQTLFRLRQSTQARVLAELALVRICTLEDLDSLPALIAELRDGSPASGPGGATPTPRPAVGGSTGSPAASARAAVAASLGAADSSPPPSSAGDSPPAQRSPASGPAAGAVIPFTPENATELWSRAIAQLSGMAADHAKHFDRVAISAPNRLVVFFKPGYTFAKSVCERPDQTPRFQQLLSELAGQPVAVSFEIVGGEEAPSPSGKAKGRVVTPQQRLMEAAEHPMVRRAKDLFGAEPTRVTDPPKGSGGK